MRGAWGCGRAVRGVCKGSGMRAQRGSVVMRGNNVGETMLRGGEGKECCEI